MSKQLLLDVHNKLIVDLFAGGGGMSTAFEMVLGRSPDIAINHNEDALSMHRANHPQTRHFIADVYEVCPRGATQGRPVGWLHLSPDCTHHSQARGGQPRDKKIRGLSWVGYHWAGQVSPDIISLENVEQIRKWGPLIAKRCKETGRVLKLDGTVAANGERVPVQEQYLIPDPKREGQTWAKFKRSLEHLGYAVQEDISVAADLGGHTTRKRLFLIARRDGLPIVMPTQTHFKKPGPGQKKHKAVAECLDFSLPCPSIFTRKKPLADATLRRIARGIVKFVLENPNPFIVPIAHYNGRDTAHSTTEPLRTIAAATKGGEFSLVSPSLVQAGHGEGTPDAPRWSYGIKDILGPLGTTTASGGGHALAAATLVQTGYGEREGQAPRCLDIEAAIGTAVGTQKHAIAAATLVGVGGPEYSGKPTPVDLSCGTVMPENHRGMATAYLAQMNGGFNQTPGHGCDESASTITNSGSQQQLVTANMVTLRKDCTGSSAEDAIGTITAGAEHHALMAAHITEFRSGATGGDVTEPIKTMTAGGHPKRDSTGNVFGLVECTLTPDDEAGALQVAAFLMRYHREGGQWARLDDPMTTITTKDRLALVTVIVQGTPYVITDIGLRMLIPPELYRAQDFPTNYIIAHGHDGRKFSKSAQVRMVGNSVDPVQAAAYIEANAVGLAINRRKAA